jgi:nitrate reductase delta subunit
VAAVLELCGQRVQAVPIVADEAMDDVWQEPEAFDGCSTKGQSKPGEAQTIHFVRKTVAPAPEAATAASIFAKGQKAPEAHAQGARI